MEQGAFSANNITARLHHTGPTPTQLGVVVDGFSAVTAWLHAVTAVELPEAARAVVAASSHALERLEPPLPLRSAWSVDVTAGRTFTLWCEHATSTATGDSRVLLLGIELLLRAMLHPWEGMLAVDPGADVDLERAPAWVGDGRQAHIDVLATLRRIGWSTFASCAAPVHPPLVAGGRFNGVQRVTLSLDPVAIVLDDPALTAFFACAAPIEWASIAEQLVHGGSLELEPTPAAFLGVLGTREHRWTLATFDQEVDLTSTSGIDWGGERSELLPPLHLLLRAIAQPWEHCPIDGSGEPDTAPAWVGRIRRVETLVAWQVEHPFP